MRQGNPVEQYFHDLHQIHGSGAGVAETSYYPALSALLNAIGATLKPKTHCIIHLANQGAGIPDGGIFAASQIPKHGADQMPPGQLPERGAIEVKGLKDDVVKIAKGAQVAAYLTHYRQVLVTNCREFVLMGHDAQGQPAMLEAYSMAKDEPSFWTMLDHPKKAAEQHGERLTEYLMRVMLHAASLATPEAVAWFLASYARDAKVRIEHSELDALQPLRDALEQTLGLSFKGDKGEHFFRSTLVQTLFYGVFSAWVLWCKENTAGKFDWKQAAWTLHVPMIRALFHQVADPAHLQPLGLVEPLDWAAAVLNRVDRDAFFKKFDEIHAVQYFYEPFLQSFDPELRKELGVWYTPPEIVEYMVARVDAVLRDELDRPDGLADPDVYILDPCCGTGAYLVEVLRVIAERLRENGGDALVAQDLKEAARNRVFGFEIMPAPFVVAHLQLSLLLQRLGAPLSHHAGPDERVAVYLTNALTGWDPLNDPKTQLVFPEMQEEHDLADEVKRNKKILVILGNPPYNGYAGTAMGEERDLSTAYRTTKLAPKPQGQGLNELYIRFFRMAEHKIIDDTKEGIVCFISNYSWLDGLSHTGMREKYLDVFDSIWIDCLNGDKYKTGKLTPEGDPDPSVFSTQSHPVGIQVGTAIALMLRKKAHKKQANVRFRHFWGKNKREDLLEAVNPKRGSAYAPLDPALPLGLPFTPVSTAGGYLDWPKLPDLFPVSFPGVQTGRDQFLVDIDRNRLEERLSRYFDKNISNNEMRRLCPCAMTSTQRFSAEEIREYLHNRGKIPENVVRFAYRPFDVRWLYWEPETKLLDEKRSDYWAHARVGNLWLTAAQQNRKEFDRPYVTNQLACRHIIERGANLYPLFLNHEVNGETLFSATDADPPVVEPNNSPSLQKYIIGMECDSVENVFLHSSAVMHTPQYTTENITALRQDWPRIPLPITKPQLETSATLGREIAALMDTEKSVAGVTSGALRTEMKPLAVVSRVGGGSINPNADELEVRASWGRGGQGEVTMPGSGRLTERAYTPDERAAIEAGAAALGLTAQQALDSLGETTCDVWMNDVVFWRNVPKNVWEYTLGGYQVIKKWLSYRECSVLGRSLSIDEAREVMNIARRIAALLLLGPALDANYAAVKADTYPWPK